MKAPVLITGCPRSGTSMTAGVIHLCGAFGGEMRGATSNNRRGMFENKAIIDTVVKPRLRELDVDPMGQWPLPSTKNLPIDGSWTDRVTSIILREGYLSGSWFYKCPKTCLLWPQWHHAFPDAKWVIVRRDTEDIIDSLMRTSFMRAFRNREGWRGWVEHHLACLAEMHKEGLDIIEFWPDPSDPQRFHQMVEWVGLSWNGPAVVGFLAPELYHRSAA